MTAISRPLRLVGGRVVLRDEVRNDVDVRIRGDRIEAIVPSGEPVGDDQVVDVGDAWLMPGMIDIHADYTERMMDEGVVDDKWGPAGAVRLTENRWLFFGWASS
mgnify:CR=1 FL=1